MMRLLLVVFACVVFPLQSFAQSTTPITRRDGFLQLWQSLGRPALKTNKAWFHDVKEGDKGHLEIIYAASRNIIDKGPDNFYPDEPLTLGEGLVWLFRTRNVDDPENITVQSLSGFLLSYPIAHMPNEQAAAAALTEDQLVFLERSLDTHLREEDHEVSLYAEKWHGQGTAFGEKFDMNMLTAAHRTFPHNTLVKVTNVRNGKSVIVRINDRGPFVKGRDMDMSLAAFTAIEDRSKGIMRATFQRLGDANLVNGCEPSMRRYQTRLSKKGRLEPGIPRTLATGEELRVSSNEGFLLRSIRYPDGTVTSVRDWYVKDEPFTFKPSVVGTYSFALTSLDGRVRTLEMNVSECGAQTITQ